MEQKLLEQKLLEKLFRSKKILEFVKEMNPFDLTKILCQELGLKSKDSVNICIGLIQKAKDEGMMTFPRIEKKMQYPVPLKYKFQAAEREKDLEDEEKIEEGPGQPMRQNRRDSSF